MNVKLREFAFSAIMIFIWVLMVESAEYRHFKNQKGQTIVAQVVKYDAKGGRVQLELKNHKKAWVDLSSLSEVDQAYIRNLDLSPTETPESKAKSKPLSKPELMAIGEKYISAVETRSRAAMKLLFLNPERVRYRSTSLEDEPPRMRIKKIYVDDGLVLLQTDPQEGIHFEAPEGDTYVYLGKHIGRGVEMYAGSQYQYIW